jgi:hypothetical protein
MSKYHRYKNTCEFCGKEFLGSHKEQKYCSKDCFNAAHKESHKHTHLIENVCKKCGTVFYVKYKKKVYCDTCWNEIKGNKGNREYWKNMKEERAREAERHERRVIENIAVSPTVKKCWYCGKQHRNIMPYCSFKCLEARMSGAKNIIIDKGVKDGKQQFK